MTSRYPCVFTYYSKLVVFLVLLAAASAAEAKKADGGLNSKELVSIQPLLKKHGVVALSEVDAAGNPKAVTLAIRIKASKETIFGVFSDPEKYYYISRLFRENKVIQSYDGTKAWTWASRHKFFSFTGMNTVSLFPPRRADVTFVKGTVGNGSFTFMIHDDDKKHSILVLHGLLDVESSEWFIRFLLSGNPAMKQAMNMALGLVAVKGIKALAEVLEKGKKVRKHRTHGKAGGPSRLLQEKELVRLAPLLLRGQVVVTDSNPRGKLKQATVLGLMNAPANKIHKAVATPSNYAKMIKSISDISVHKADKNAIDFSWTIGLSIFGLTSKNKMKNVEGGVLIEGVEGDLADATWRWQIIPTSKNQSVVAYHSFAYVNKASSILRSTVKAEPYLEHGIMAGSNMVMHKAIRKAIEQP